MKLLLPATVDCPRLARLALTILILTAGLVGVQLAAAADEESTPENSPPAWHELLEQAGIGKPEWDSLEDDRPLAEAELPLVMRLFYRLEHTDPGQLDAWTLPAPPLGVWLDDPAAQRGELFWAEGIVLRVEAIRLPEEMQKALGTEQLFLCRMELGQQRTAAMVVVPRVPRDWLSAGVLPQPVRFRAMFLKATETNDRPAAMLLAQRLAWFPTENASPGKLLLAAEGMDVALLDEVRHRSPFAKPDQSHEAEAFYACLAATKRAGEAKLTAAARENLPAFAEQWKQRLQNAKQARRQLEKQLPGAVDEAARQSLQVQLGQARREEQLAMAVVDQAARGSYSVAPLFLQPQKQAGQLILVEGLARRAVKIAAARTDAQTTSPSDETPPPAPSHYYELEVFTADSQNLPVVCCVAEVPPDFPLGDKIREPVRVAGVFFKSWLFRTRQPKTEYGRASMQRLYAPIVIGAEVERLADQTGNSGHTGLWAGISMLALLAALWWWAVWHGRRDRRLRSQLRQEEPPQFETTQDTKET